MSAFEATIEQRIVQAGMECQALVQATDDQLKADYIREKCGLNHPLSLKARVGRFFASLSASQLTLRLAVNSALILSFGGLHVADGIVTYLGLTFAELAEVNPVLNYFSGLLGLGVSICLLKLVILAVIVAIFMARRTIKSHWGTATLGMAVMFYCGVVISNMMLVAGL
ncbi:hypothetical protein IVG45_18725 [Methylomonas sp. LL1]|uniref:DUF5658 family protein n=1 Tax=Methylomonas sp. LL1 TaxID=2785785 RepID=UPI0018C41A60|nr:DUF5658 family protein [Methylomonas sp. LL1]QPK62840.1 hypothetical protein IVG45_18725 [Methylomonas sp. LL1]